MFRMLRPSLLVNILWFLLESFVVPIHAVPQTVYAPFSGILYLVYPNGAPVSTSSLTCPASAPNACSNLNSPNWCCPSGYVCAVPADQPSLIGCCPNGQSCAGTPSVTTITVAAAPEVAPSTVAIAETPTVVVVAQTTVVNPQGGYCSTLTAAGPGLPTTARAACGTILIVNSAEALRAVSNVAVIAVSFWVGGFLLTARIW